MDNYWIFVITTPVFQVKNLYKLGITNNLNNELHNYRLSCPIVSDCSDAYLPYLHHIYCTDVRAHEVERCIKDIFLLYQLSGKKKLGWYNIKNNILHEEFSKFIKLNMYSNVLNTNNTDVEEFIDDISNIHVPVHPQVSLPIIQITDETISVNSNTISSSISEFSNNNELCNHILHPTIESVDFSLKTGNVQLLKYLLWNETIKPVKLQRIGAMDIAIQNDQLDMVKYLNSLDLEHTVKLSTVIEKGNLDMIYYLVPRMMNVTYSDLNCAIKKRDIVMIKYFVPNIIKSADSSNLDCAICNDTQDIIEYFIGTGTQIIRSNIECAITKGNLSLIKYLYTQTSDIKLDNHSISFVIQKDHLEIFEYLHALGIIIDNSDINLIIRTGALKILKYLVSRGIELTNDCITLASNNGHIDMIHYLIDIKIPPNIDVANIAVQKEDLELLQYVCNLGIMPDIIKCRNIKDEILLYLLSMAIKNDKSVGSTYNSKVSTLCLRGIKLTNDYIIANPTNNEFILRNLFGRLILSEDVIRYYITACNQKVLEIIFDRYSSDPKINDYILSKNFINEILGSQHISITNVMSWAIHCKRISKPVPIQYLEIIKDSIKHGFIPYNYNETNIDIKSIVYEGYGGYTANELNMHIERYEFKGFKDTVKYRCATNLMSIIQDMKYIKELIENHGN